MRKLKNPEVLLDGTHFKIEYEKRTYTENIVEIIHVIHKKSKKTSEHYSSNYAHQSEF